jgi:hypothetical protein
MMLRVDGVTGRPPLDVDYIKYMKKILISSIVILLALIGVTALYNHTKSPTVTPVVVTPLPTPGTTTPISGSSISITTQDGDVTIPDIRSLPQVKDVGNNMYHLEGTQSEADAGFALLYSAADNSFSIAIEKTPIKLYRERASLYFIDFLHINKIDACKLRVLVGVTTDMDAQLSGKNLGLSFCPDSIKLP